MVTNSFLMPVYVSVIISLISFAGTLTFILGEKKLERITVLLIGFAAGTLIGGAFIHLLPETFETAPPEKVFNIFLAGFCFFFLMERFLHWRHCHKGHCEIHPFGYLNLAGGAVHNITDGMVIAAAYALGGSSTGLPAAIAVAAHKLPHEFGDIAVLISSGFSRKKAVMYNYISDLFIIAGAIIGVLLINRIEGMQVALSAASAGGFVYVAASDLIPMIHQNRKQGEANLAFVFFAAGLVFMWLNRHLSGH